MSRRSQRATIEAASQTVADVRKRAAQDVLKAEKFGSEPLLRSLVPVCDNVDMLLKSAQESGGGGAGEGPILEGAQLTAKSLLAALEKHDVRKVAPGVGDPFDPADMEAMYPVATEQKADADKVAAVLRPGYALHERILRAAQVGVTVHQPAKKDDAE